MAFEYTGTDECTFGLQLQIAGRTFSPGENNQTMKNVPEGTQRYEVVRGNVFCPGQPDCDAYGSGMINVMDGQTYYLVYE